jgi:hypothetical protein
MDVVPRPISSTAYLSNGKRMKNVWFSGTSAHIFMRFLRRIEGSFDDLGVIVPQNGFGMAKQFSVSSDYLFLLLINLKFRHILISCALR